MKKFKETDIAISIILILCFTIISLIKLDYTFIIGYFTVGSWHLISIVIHLNNKWFTQQKSGRYYYSWIVFGIAITAALGFVFYPLLLIFYLLLFAAPFMALYYTFLCYSEIRLLNKRPLYDLK
jgi:hypothetical protein